MAAAKTPPHTTYAPRPSISPLSTASKANKQSPIATRDAMMQDADLQEDIERNAAAANRDAVGVDEDDNASSDLSEIDDTLDDEAHGNGIDDDLSDEEAATPQKSLDEVDSEAETERLHQTPQGQRKLDVTGRTPSKLSQAAAAIADELSEPPSPLPVGPGAASSTSTIATAGLKRKRHGSDDSSLTSADSDIGESPRKRSQELKSGEQEHGDNLVQETGVQGDEEVEAIADTPGVIEAVEPIAIPRKGLKGKKGKQKGRPPKEPVEATEIEQQEEHVEPETEVVEEDPAKKEEALKAKKEAMELFESVAKSHRAFQELLNRERLADVARQLDMLEEKDSTHPEYRAQVACVDMRLQKHQSEARAFYRYKLRSIRERTLGERSQLHSQYFQQVRDLREDALEKLGETAYAITNQRRLESIVPENDDAFVYKYNPKKSAQIRQQAKYNQEVSILSGMAKYVGFPAAPEIRGVEGSAMEDDLKAMKISKRAVQPTSQRPAYIPPANTTTLAQNERLAHEQFIERNAWAQSQGPLHTLNTPNISHTPDWADQPLSNTGGGPKHLARNFSGQTPGLQRTGSPYTTPLPQKRTPLDFSSSGTVAVGNSDGLENPPSSVVAAPPTSHRISLLNDPPPTNGGGPQTSPLTVPKQRHHYQPQSVPPRDRDLSNRASREHERDTRGEKELTGFRNISNSTIDAPILPDSTTDLHQQHQRIIPHDLPPGPHAHLYAHRDLSSPGHAHLTHLLRAEDSAPLQAFDTSAFHRQGEPHGANGTPLRVVDGFGSRGQTPVRREAGFPFVAGFRPGQGEVFGSGGGSTGGEGGG